MNHCENHVSVFVSLMLNLKLVSCYEWQLSLRRYLANLLRDVNTIHVHSGEIVEQ